MAVRQLSKSTIAQGLPRGSKFWDGLTFLSDYDSIATVTVGAGGTSSVEFTSIPATYKHLQIRVLSQSTYSASADQDAFSLQFNGDTASNYSDHKLIGNGSSASAAARTNGSYIELYQQTNAQYTGGVIFTVGVIDILDYADTNKYKTVRALAGNDTNGTGGEPGRIFFSSGNWRSTNAITSIKFQSSSMTRGFLQYSHFALYGIKAA